MKLQMMFWLMLFWCTHLAAAAADDDVEKQCLNDVSSYFLCGNICLYGTSICTCGNDRLYSENDKYCCIPSGYNIIVQDVVSIGKPLL